MRLDVILPEMCGVLGLIVGSVENQDSPWRLGVIQAFDG
jgi:hypothetical protein